MHVQRTIAIKLEHDTSLSNTLAIFTHIKQTLSVDCFNAGTPLNMLDLQRQSFERVKGVVNSQMTCTAIRIVAGAYAAAKRSKHKTTQPFLFKRKSALFLIGARGRDASFHKSGKLSIWTVNGRKKLAYSIPNYFKASFASAVSYDSLMVTLHKGKLMGYLCITLDVPDPVSACPVGVDLNETNMVVAVDKDGKTFFKTGLKTKILNRRTRKTRKRLQRKLASKKAEHKNTRSVRRVLKRLGKLESRRTKDFAMVTAKQLCKWAGPNSVIVFENLKFKQQRKYDGKTKATHRKLSAFPHSLIRQCVTNKAELLGIGVAKVNPYNTSRICSKCGLVGERSRHMFACPHCGFLGHSDINAAVNIRNRFTSLRASGVQSTTPEASI